MTSNLTLTQHKSWCEKRHAVKFPNLLFFKLFQLSNKQIINQKEQINGSYKSIKLDHMITEEICIYLHSKFLTWQILSQEIQKDHMYVQITHLANLNILYEKRLNHNSSRLLCEITTNPYLQDSNFSSVPKLTLLSLFLFLLSAALFIKL